MSQRDAEKVEMMKDIPRKEEFQKYLEKAGVIDQLTKLLVSLYENPDRPENALDYIKQFLGANHGQNANEEKLQQRIAELESEMKQKDEEIRELENELEKNRQMCKDLEDDVDKNTKYEEFLERVKETDADNYSEIQDLVTRYETLESANKDLMELQTQSENRIEELRKQYNEYRKEQDDAEIDIRNNMDRLRSELDEKQKTRQQLQHEVDAATQESSKHSLYFGQILMSVENIHIRCTKKRERHPA